MKVILTDNFDREGPGHDDKLLFYVNNPETAKEVVRLLNEDCDDPYCENFFKAVPNDYKLYQFKP